MREQRSPSTPILPRAAVGFVLTVGVVIGALTLSQLGSGADDDNTLRTRDRTPTTEAPATPAPPHGEPIPESEQTLADGRHFGEVRGAYVAPNELAFDPMELVPGDTEDGAFSLRNPAVDVRSLPVSDKVVVTVVDCSGAGCVEGKPAEYGAFTRKVDDDSAGPFFWLTVRDGTVVRIDEQYLP